MLDEGRALPIGNPIVECLSLACVFNVAADWVRRLTETISRYAPEFVLKKSDPARVVETRKFGTFAHDQKRHVGGEGLIKPDVTPPLDSDQITEPDVAELMQGAHIEA